MPSRAVKPASRSALVCGLGETAGLNRVLERYRSQVIEKSTFLVGFEGDPREALAAHFPLYLEAARFIARVRTGVRRELAMKTRHTKDYVAMGLMFGVNRGSMTR